MYICKACGNKRLFIENNCIETTVTINASTGEVTWTEDKFLGCAEVICGVCKASSEDEEILDRDTMEPVVT